MPYAIDAAYYQGHSVGYAGDFNHDGIDDFLFVNVLFETSIVVFGRDKFHEHAGSVVLSKVGHYSGLLLNVKTGTAVRLNAAYAGDINHDGMSDLLTHPYPPMNVQFRLEKCM